MVVCGDLNARFGGLSNVDEESARCCVDLEKNGQGELLVQCMRSSGLVFVNGRQGQFTCISSRGSSVVDYCLVPGDELTGIQNFVVKTMSQCEEELCVGEEGYRIPNHSALMWDILVDGGPVLSPCLYTKVHEVRPLKKLVVPEDYMHDQEDFIADIVVRLKGLKDDQEDLDSIYCELLEGLKSGLKEINCDGRRGKARYGSPRSSRS